MSSLIKNFLLHWTIPITTFGLSRRRCYGALHLDRIAASDVLRHGEGGLAIKRLVAQEVDPAECLRMATGISQRPNPVWQRLS